MNRNVRRGSVGRANKVGWSTWAFTLGWVIPLIIALITTFLPTAGWGESVWWFFALVILGLLIGYGFNKDSMGLLYVTLILALLMTFAPVADVPVIGFDMVSGQYVLNYTLTFTPNNAEAGGNWASGNDLETTDLTMLGRTYYVLSARNTTATNHKLTLLDTANSALITDGETKTITIGDKTYEVSIDFIDATNVILNVNGAQTNKLAEGGVYKIATDTYIAVKSNLYDAKESGISKAEISIGSGKIEIQKRLAVFFRFNFSDRMLELRPRGSLAVLQLL